MLFSRFKRTLVLAAMLTQDIFRPGIPAPAVAPFATTPPWKAQALCASPLFTVHHALIAFPLAQQILASYLAGEDQTSAIFMAAAWLPSFQQTEVLPYIDIEVPRELYQTFFDRTENRRPRGFLKFLRENRDYITYPESFNKVFDNNGQICPDIQVLVHSGKSDEFRENPDPEQPPLPVYHSPKLYQPMGRNWRILLRTPLLTPKNGKKTNDAPTAPPSALPTKEETSSFSWEQLQTLAASLLKLKFIPKRAAITRMMGLYPKFRTELSLVLDLWKKPPEEAARLTLWLNDAAPESHSGDTPIGILMNLTPHDWAQDFNAARTSLLLSNTPPQRPLPGASNLTSAEMRRIKDLSARLNQQNQPTTAAVLEQVLPAEAAKFHAKVLEQASQQPPASNDARSANELAMQRQAAQQYVQAGLRRLVRTFPTAALNQNRVLEPLTTRERRALSATTPTNREHIRTFYIPLRDEGKTFWLSRVGDFMWVPFSGRVRLLRLENLKAAQGGFMSALIQTPAGSVYRVYPNYVTLTPWNGTPVEEHPDVKRRLTTFPDMKKRKVRGSKPTRLLERSA